VVELVIAHERLESCASVSSCDAQRGVHCPTGGIFAKYNFERVIRGFQPITARITFRIIDEACLAMSYLYEAGLVQSSGL